MKFKIDSITVIGTNQVGDTQYDIRYSILGTDDEVLSKHQAPLINAYDREEMIKKLRIRVKQQWEADKLTSNVDVVDALGS